MSITEVIEQPKPKTEIADVREKLGAMADQFQMALPEHIPLERFMRVVMTAIQGNPYLLKMDRRTLFGAAMKAAQDGLLPDGREGALVPFAGEVTWIPMIAGLRKKVRNSGEIATWDVAAVYANDKFEFELGDDPFIKHAPTLKDKGELIAVYSIATLKSGEKSRDVMGIDDVTRIRDRSNAWKQFKAGKIKSTPWQTDFDEMAKKTVARRHSKVLPMSTDLDDLIRRDDALYDFDGAREEARDDAPKPKTLAGRLDALAGVDSETGEITEHDAGGKPAEEKGAPLGAGAPEAAAGEGEPRPKDAPAAADDPSSKVRGHASLAAAHLDKADEAAVVAFLKENGGDLNNGEHVQAAISTVMKNKASEEAAATNPAGKDWRAEGVKAGLRGMSLKAIPPELREPGMEAQAEEWKAGHADGVEQRKAG